MPVEQEIPNIRPRALFRSRGDNSLSIEAVGRSDTMQRRRLSDFFVNETRVTFGVVMDDSADGDEEYIVGSLSQGEEQTLFYQEQGEQLPYTPEIGLNLATTALTASLSGEAKLEYRVNGSTVLTRYIDGYSPVDTQIAELEELQEYVEELDGENDVEWAVVNETPGNVEGTVRIRNVESFERQFAPDAFFDVTIEGTSVE